MKFIVEKMSKGGGRLGSLSGLRSQPDKILSTPMSLITTKGGSAPHLTQDVLHLVTERDAPLCVPAQHFCEHIKVLQKFRKGVSHFAALQGHSVGMVVQDPAKTTPSGYNDKHGVSTWTHTGRHILTPDTYMQLVDMMQPDWYEALSDADTSASASKKRVSKALTQSRHYLTTCLNFHRDSQSLQGCGVLVPLLGGHSKADRSRWSKGLSQWVQEEPLVSGFVLLGLHANGPEVEQLNSQLVQDLAKASLDSLPEDGLVQAGGGWNPATVLSLVELGVDVFDSTFPYLVTQRSGALAFPCQLDRDRTVPEVLVEEASLEHRSKRLKTCEGEEAKERKLEEVEEKEQEEEEKEETHRSKEKREAQKGKEGEEKSVKSGGKETQLENGEQCNTSAYEICLRDKRYMVDEGPLLDGCQCYTCRNFSRAYVHHLVNVKEMLAPVLLMIHNLHHWNCFFSSIREAVSTDCLHDFKALVTSVVRGSADR